MATRDMGVRGESKLGSISRIAACKRNGPICEKHSPWFCSLPLVRIPPEHNSKHGVVSDNNYFGEYTARGGVGEDSLKY